jgi:hypothetical protein
MLEPAIGITLACLLVVRPMLVSGFSSLSKSNNKSESHEIRSSNFHPLDEDYPLHSVGRDSKTHRAANMEVGSEHGSTKDVNDINSHNAIQGNGPLGSHRVDRLDGKILVTEEWAVS